MRIAFIIVCMAAIGITVVHIRTEENILRNKMLTLQNYYQIEVPRQLMQQQKELACLSAPVKVQERAVAMGLPLVDKDLKTGLARSTPDAPDSPRKPKVTAAKPGVEGRPNFNPGHTRD